MNSLVGYGSSDDEDDGNALTSPPESGTTIPVLTNGNSTLRVEALAPTLVMASEGPMVGPSMPTDGLEVDAYEEDTSRDLSPMSEGDLLRYLTQPSHPMASLPPEPTSQADPAVTARFKRFLQIKSKGIHFNEDLAGKCSFKNPSLLASLLERTDLPAQAQYVSALPSDLFSIDTLPSWAYKEDLLNSQQTVSADLEVAKKAQSAAGKRMIEFTSSGERPSRESTAGVQVKRKHP